MNPLANIHARAAQDPKHIVLAEGSDARIVEGAVKASRQGIAKITLIGDEADIRPQTRNAGDVNDDITIIDPHTSTDLEIYAKDYLELAPLKAKNIETARMAMATPLNFANMRVRRGQCDGSVAGADNASGDVIRSAQRLIGLQSEEGMISSYFIMQLPEGLRDGALVIFADCACVVSPDKDQLARIAATTADSAKALLGLEPKIALLSFSTRGSARHPQVKRVERAGLILNELRPDLPVESAVQFDAAFDVDVAMKKAPDSDVAGRANIFVFPDLNSGNIGYKIAQRIGGAKAIGPIFQGLAKPANDLSRGCTAEDVFNMIAVTAVQAQNSEALC